MMRPAQDLPVVYLCRDPVDFRKGINSLAVLVEDVLCLDPFSEHLFVFCNRSRSGIKILYWERNGFCLWQKRLERDRFYWPRSCCCRCKSAVICRDLILTRRMPGGFLSSTFGGWFLPDFLGACWFWLFPGSDVAEPANGLPPIASWQS